MFSMQRIIQIIEQGMPAIKTTNVVDQSVPTVDSSLTTGVSQSLRAKPQSMRAKTKELFYK